MRQLGITGNLYTLAVPESAAFEQYCGGNLGGSNETCVSFTAIPGAEHEEESGLH